MNDDKALQDFIAKYARTFDPETDDYDRPPFAADIKEGKNDPIYNAHSYHTKVPPRGILPYILHYTEPGDLILDPFCGSGMTGVAALMCANPPTDLLEQFPELKERIGPRRAILNDLSPAACHIAYNYTTPFDVEALRREFERIKAAVKEEFDWLYGTEHYEPAIGLYDPHRSEVAERLKNQPDEVQTANRMFAEESRRTWELIDRAEVERRLGYPVTELPRSKDWGDADMANVVQWLCIPAMIQYTVWSDVYRCEGFITLEEPTGKISSRGKNAGKPIVKKTRVARGCGKEILLWEAALDRDTGQVSDTFSCPKCGQIWKKLQLTRIGNVPVVTMITFEGLSATGRGRNAGLRMASKRVQRHISIRDLARLKDIEAKSIPGPYPKKQIDVGREMMRHGLLARGLRNEKDFYSPRLLWGLSKLWVHILRIQDSRMRQAVQFAFTAILHRCSLLNRLRPSGAGDPLMGTLYIGSLWRENNVLEDFLGRENAITVLASIMSEGKVTTRCGTATDLSEIPNASVDYIFTDPPFASNIFYSDCSLLWESWLGRYTDEELEIVINDRRVNGPNKDIHAYSRLMYKSFLEMNRVLKPGRCATVEFNNSDGQVFEVIKQAATEAGFEITNMLLLDKKQKTFKQIQGAKGEADVVDKDVLFNLHKPAVMVITQLSDTRDLEHRISDTVREYLKALPERMKSDPIKYNEDHRTTATINSVLMNTLIPRGVSVDRLNLPFIERVCHRYFRKVGNRWYLRGEAIGIQNGSGVLIEEEVAIKDEVSAIEWIRQRLKSGPLLVGELKPLWMRATGLLPAGVSQQLNLDDLLAENFWRDANTNRWREPTEDERERMNDDRSIRVLHDAERFVANTLRRKTTDAELCEWIDVLFQVCKQAEDLDEGASLPLAALRGFDPGQGYRLISRLFQSVLREMVTPADYGRAEKQARVASQRLSKASQESTASAEGKRGAERKQMTLDWTEEQ